MYKPCTNEYQLMLQLLHANPASNSGPTATGEHFQVLLEVALPFMILLPKLLKETLPADFRLLVCSS